MKHQQTLMIQGTTSDAGKSAIVVAICRLLHRHGITVAPFKPQNMALNSAVSIDGGEIGRAQAVQAQACGLEPHTDMNPVLLKPSTDIGAQVIIQGRAIDNMNARTYHQYKPKAMAAVLESYHRLKSQYDVIIVEGAGSPAEINLRDRDIANMGFAEVVDCPVLIIADIDKGGVFAHLMGTLAVLSPSEQTRIKGFIINKFRGDISLLTPGNEWLEQQTGKPVLAVLPYLTNLHLEAEDAITIKDRPYLKNNLLKVIIPVIPRISNHTDFDPLQLNPHIDIQFVAPGQPVPAADLIILPGSKNVGADLEWLQQQGWESTIKQHLRYGGKVLGICGGFQMLGQKIKDPLGTEGDTRTYYGLNLLDFETTLHKEKQLHQIEGYLNLPGNPHVKGYEIHTGISKGSALERPATFFKYVTNTRYSGQRSDGAISSDNQIIGTYIHGLFEQESACYGLLTWAGADKRKIKIPNYSAIKEASINRLADNIEKYLGYDNVLKLLQC